MPVISVRVTGTEGQTLKLKSQSFQSSAQTTSEFAQQPELKVNMSAPSIPKYNEDLRAPIETSVNDSPKVKVHRVEWAKVLSGDPVEINPSVGSGFRVMSVEEWAARWKCSEEFPDCLACGGSNTKEHAFTQTWCRGKRVWESECLCLDCHKFTYRFYRDPDFKTPEQYEKERWTELVKTTGVTPVAPSRA